MFGGRRNKAPKDGGGESGSGGGGDQERGGEGGEERERIMAITKYSELQKELKIHCLIGGNGPPDYIRQLLLSHIELCPGKGYHDHERFLASQELALGKGKGKAVEPKQPEPKSKHKPAPYSRFAGPSRPNPRPHIPEHHLPPASLSDLLIPANIQLLHDLPPHILAALLALPQIAGVIEQAQEEAERERERANTAEEVVEARDARITELEAQVERDRVFRDNVMAAREEARAAGERLREEVEEARRELEELEENDRRRQRELSPNFRDAWNREYEEEGEDEMISDDEDWAGMVGGMRFEFERRGERGAEDNNSINMEDDDDEVVEEEMVEEEEEEYEEEMEEEEEEDLAAPQPARPIFRLPGNERARSETPPPAYQSDDDNEEVDDEEDSDDADSEGLPDDNDDMDSVASFYSAPRNGPMAPAPVNHLEVIGGLNRRIAELQGEVAAAHEETLESIRREAESIDARAQAVIRLGEVNNTVHDLRIQAIESEHQHAATARQNDETIRRITEESGRLREERERERQGRAAVDRELARSEDALEGATRGANELGRLLEQEKKAHRTTKNELGELRERVAAQGAAQAPNRPNIPSEASDAARDNQQNPNPASGVRSTVGRGASASPARPRPAPLADEAKKEPVKRLSARLSENAGGNEPSANVLGKRRAGADNEQQGGREGEGSKPRKRARSADSSEDEENEAPQHAQQPRHEPAPKRRRNDDDVGGKHEGRNAKRARMLDDSELENESELGEGGREEGEE